MDTNLDQAMPRVLSRARPLHQAHGVRTLSGARGFQPSDRIAEGLSPNA